MPRPFALPDLGEGLTEAEIVKVLVAEGDVIAEDAPLLEVETDKATVEIPSPMAGRVAKIHVQPGQTVKVGAVLVTFDDETGRGGGRPSSTTITTTGLGEPLGPERCPALPAELLAGRDARAAGGAGRVQLGAALFAELHARATLGLTGGTAHRRYCTMTP